MSTDNQSTETNPYYFYQLTSSQDLLPETFQRRVSKSTQAQNKGFLFCLFDSDQFFKNYCDFIDQQSRSCDALMVPWTLFQEHKNVLQGLVERKALSVFYMVSTTNEFSDAEPDLNQPRHFVVLQAKTRKEAQLLLDRTEKLSEEIRQKVSFLPRQFNQASGQKVSAVDYLDLLKSKKLTNLSRNFQIPFWNEGVDPNYELEPLVDLSWSISASTRRTDLVTVSVIIPTFNNSRFLVNVLTHLADQQAVPESYEVIIVDDGSEDSSSEIIKKYVQSHKLEINLRYLYWSKKDLGRGPQNFFRPGQARNLAAKYAIGEYLMFLDSDMLVPPTFINECQQALNKNDLIQFQRYHIKQTLSLTNPRWKDVVLNKDCYIEEKHYWSQLFNCEDWNQLPQKWKFVCTYALGIRREEFFKTGRFKRHFISYGFEDTDLGFRMYKQNKKFKLIKTPLLHLTNYSQMQYQNSSFKRHELLSVTAKLFFLDHLDFEIGSTLRTFLGGEKGLIDRFKDRFLDN